MTINRLFPSLLFLAACGDGSSDPMSVASSASASSKDAGPAAPPELDAEEAARIRNYIERRYDGLVVITEVQDGSGMVFDCVTVETQPGLRVRDPQTGAVSFRPVEEIPEDVLEEAARKAEEIASREPVAGESEAADDYLDCPAGTVPVKQPSFDAIARFGSLDAYLERGWELPGTTGHEYAKVDYVADVQGGASVVNIWNPFVDEPYEFSLAQIWVVRGSGSDRETVEAGWQDYPNRTGSVAPRFFVFTTQDDYATVCYDQDDCDDWVQVSSELAPGFGWTNHSTPGGAQYVFDMEYYRGLVNGNWYLIYKGDILGYYPGTLFDSAGLGPKASRISFGGEVAVDNTTAHSTTDMGNGNFPPSGFAYAAYFRDLQKRNSLAMWSAVPAGSLTEYRTDADCYEVESGTASAPWNTYFYFGGEGHGTYCP